MFSHGFHCFHGRNSEELHTKFRFMITQVIGTALGVAAAAAGRHEAKVKLMSDKVTLLKLT